MHLPTISENSQAVAATTDGSGLVNWASAAGQPILAPPTVFNYYHPDYTLPGTSVVAPEFELHTPAAAVSRANFVQALTFGNAGATTPDWTLWTTLAADTAQLLDGLDHLMLHGQMSAAMRTAVSGAVSVVPASNLLGRAKQAFYLVATASPYQVAQ